ncbi:hypothetical protein NMY22_g9764 [Coprinellus aureogranulatus]|nr:hypothetical protein NMY22_g9764 [Coprinellus aureogranulatus]
MSGHAGATAFSAARQPHKLQRRRAMSLESAKSFHTTMDGSYNAPSTPYPRHVVDRRAVEEAEPSTDRFDNENRVGNPDLARETRKGKGPDPGNWGGIELNDDERDVDMQHVLHRSYRQPCIEEVEDVDSPANITRRQHRQQATPRFAEVGPASHVRDRITKSRLSQPIDQVPALSMLGQMRDMEQKSRPVNPPKTPQYHEAGWDQPGEDYGSQYSSANAPQNGGRPNGNQTTPSFPAIPPGLLGALTTAKVPIPAPQKYDGTADLSKYLRLRSEFRIYVMRGRIPDPEQVPVLSSFLEGKAYDFYLHRASLYPERWDLNRFFDALFNHCFPKDFTSRLRQQVSRMRQGSRSVSEYAHDMATKLDYIGLFDEKERVHRLWDGFESAIEEFLWRDRLNPDSSSWDEVLEGAEAAEASIAASQRRNRRGHFNENNTSNNSRDGNQNRNPNSNGGRGPGNFNGQSRPQNNGYQSAGGRNNPSGNSNTSSYRKSNNGTGGARTSGPNPSGSYQSNSKRLSDEEVAAYKARGQCFHCGGHGHLSRNCHNRSLVQSNNGPGKPPGIAAFAMEMEMDEPEADVLNDLPAFSIPFGVEDSFDLIDDIVDDLGERSIRHSTARDEFRSWNRRRTAKTRDEVHEPDWMRLPKAPYLVRNEIGDALVRVAQYHLNHQQPYPGDQFKPNQPFGMRDRFGVYPATKTTYAIVDRHLGLVREVEKAQLACPTFRVAKFYALLLCNEFGLSTQGIHTNYSGVMGDAWSEVATFLLTDGVADFYPNVDPYTDTEARFSVQIWNAETDTYIVNDSDRCTYTIIDGTRLRNPHFNLIRWYQLVVQGKRGLDADTHPDGSQPPQNVSQEAAPSEAAEVETSIPGSPALSSAPIDDFDDLPALQSLSNSDYSDSDSEDEVHEIEDLVTLLLSKEEKDSLRRVPHLGDAFTRVATDALVRGAPYPGDRDNANTTSERFALLRLESGGESKSPQSRG